MKKIDQIDLNEMRKMTSSEDDFGVLLWKLESFEDFYPCYKTMIKREQR
jgi:hypothetical protein